MVYSSLLLSDSFSTCKNVSIKYTFSDIKAKESRMTDKWKETSIITEDDHKPLWITMRPGKHIHNDVYVNNVMISFNQSNIESTLNVNGKTVIQILHIINEVLEPLQYNSRNRSVYNPNAFEFLSTIENLNLCDCHVRTFRQEIIQQNEDIFKAEGRYTFFIPVDEGFKPEQRLHKIDQLVIKGHVLPHTVLFTAPTPEKVSYETLAFSNKLSVVVSFFKSQNKVYVQSDTLVGDHFHPRGRVITKIIRPNIPVRNGVVHLIQRPLMIIDITVKDFLEENKNGPVGKFYEILRNYGGKIMSSINRLNDVTLFAPSNDALDELTVKKMLQDKNWLREILQLHYVKKRLTLEDIEAKTIIGKSLKKHWYLVGEPTAIYNKKLYFDVVERSREIQTFTVEGGGRNATIIIPNIAVTNGIVHIIDRVLGVPYTNVLEKLRTYPALELTHFLGQQCGFNDQLNSTKNLTYFVPLNEAWTNPKNDSLTIKKVFEPEYSYYTKQILARHLVIADKVTYTMSKMVRMNQYFTLPSIRGNLDLCIRVYNNSYYLEWGNTTVQVVYPDIVCTDGVIHVISEVLFKKSDFQMTSGAVLSTFAPQLIMILINKWIL
ncbi:fasciclin-1-like isoform X2 [Monomorium pharaonis]|uniref:fasciclin-1-like isoform X2 n=1 Tax=Monomorium pharaonis TaxID=307658 RepID=UPI0017470542|nr:fasciclin-1-like isoform X2 [Monomorium pharaonis]